MSYGIGKKDNEYARFVDHIDAPKTVWMAIAVSFATRCMGTGDNLQEFVMDEWEKLHLNGIVAQKPRSSK